MRGRTARTARTFVVALLAAVGAAAPASAGPFDQLAGAAGCIRPTMVVDCSIYANVGSPADVVAAGTHVYVSQPADDRIRIYDRHPLTGALTPRADGPSGCIANVGGSGPTDCADAQALDSPTRMALSPDGTRLYAVITGSPAGVSALIRDPATGNLSQAPNAQACATPGAGNATCNGSGPMIATPGSVTVSPDGQDVYAAGTNGAGSDYVTLLDVVAGGGLAQRSPVAGGCAQNTVVTTNCLDARAMQNASQVTVTPDGAHVYVTSTSSNAVTGFTRSTDGGLGLIGGTDGCLRMTVVSDEGCGETDLLQGETSPIAFASNQRAYVGGVGGAYVTMLQRNTSTGGLTAPGPCASAATSGPLAPCANSADLFGTVELAVTPGGGALVVAARFGRGMHLFPIVAADGSLQPFTPPMGCLATGGSLGGVPISPCTQPRGFAFSVGSDFGPGGLALGGPFSYGVSPQAQEDGRGIVAARRALFDPTCTDGSIDVAAGQSVSVPLNCSDGDDDPITRSIVSAPGQGSLGTIDQAAGRVTYSAPSGEGGTTQTATFKGNANGAAFVPIDSNIATVTIRVAPPPAPPAPPPEPATEVPPELPTAVVTQTIEADRDRDGIPDSQDTSDASAGPDLAETAVVQVVSGDVFVRRPAGKPRSAGRAAQAPGTPAGFVPVKGAEIVPVGSVVHTLRGRIALTSVAQVVRGRRQTQRANFFDGIFQIKQARARRPVTELSLRSNFAGVCGSNPRAARGGPGATAAQQRSSRRVSRLWGDGRGRFRSRGRYSSATVRGTRWLTEDRCDGTLTRVTRGSVTVRDLRARRTVTVRAGGSYLARAQRATARRR